MHNNVRTPRGRSEPSQSPPPTDYHVQHDAEGPAKLSTTLAHALADVMGADVTEAGDVLREVVDFDALDRLFALTDDDATDPAGHVAFVVEDYRVTVYTTGRIVITPPA